MAKKIIFDCDNTMGLEGCDVDDGLALLYLLGQEKTELCGITTTYGNSTIEAVYANTGKMLAEIGRSDIPLYKGCQDQFTLASEAVEFLIGTVNSHAGEISLLATGSLTNLKAAYLRDENFFEKISELVIMGGITEELRINGKVLNELNFACDPAAAEIVLKMGRNVSVITGNNCFKAFFKQIDFVSRLASVNTLMAAYIAEKCTYWFIDMMDYFQIDGFYNWDVVAAVYLINPLVFTDNFRHVTPCAQDLIKGQLSNMSHRKEPCLINMPVINNPQVFTDEVYKAWLRLN